VGRSSQNSKVQIVVEQFIHNDLNSLATLMRDQLQRKIEENDTQILWLEMVSCLMYSALATEARVNFVGWKKLEDGWPERAPIKQKINLLVKNSRG